MKIKSMFWSLVMAFVMLPMMSSCSGDGSSDSMFGSLPKVYGEYLEAGNKLKEEAKNIKTDEDKAKYIEKTEKLKEKWSVKIEKAAKKLDGKTINFEEGMFKVTQPISFQFDKIDGRSGLIAEFNFIGAAEASYDIVLNRSYKVTSASVKMVGYDAAGQETFSFDVGETDVADKDGKYIITKGTPVNFGYFRFGGDNVEKYKNTKVLKLEVLDAEKLEE